MSAYRDKLLSIAAPRRLGRSEKVRVVDDRDGSTAGIHTKHWDGRQDAVAMPKPSIVRVSTGGGSQ